MTDPQRAPGRAPACPPPVTERAGAAVQQARRLALRTAALTRRLAEVQEAVASVALWSAATGPEPERQAQRAGYAQALARHQRQDATWYTGMAGGPLGVVPGIGPARGPGGGTPMRATVDGTVLADAPESELVRIEGNWYFPPSAVVPGVLTESPTPYTCPWKGACQYWDVVTASGTRKDGAWSYPDLRPGAVERVGTDFAGYVAFAPGVTVAD